MKIFITAILWILAGICFLVALLWLGLVAVALYVCNGCSGPNGDIWLVVLIYAQIGFPALVASIIIIVVSRVRRKRGQRSNSKGTN